MCTHPHAPTPTHPPPSLPRLYGLSDRPPFLALSAHPPISPHISCSSSPSSSSHSTTSFGPPSSGGGAVVGPSGRPSQPRKSSTDTFPGMTAHAHPCPPQHPCWATRCGAPVSGKIQPKSQRVQTF
ncbi:hypothetical protein CALVIDRAFT_542104 [Calocera viscosa TUFC12733]|uniref:Uncharacterized protein n=1 Tax=Calocera viscosa (strain TUFC12733) TaxID=1330018 RepID=A0A167H283_CALVF|nr:hypothetical protein CALVIDRAFT_542104 [Calocera viscosa TUFC12733]